MKTALKTFTLEDLQQRLLRKHGKKNSRELIHKLCSLKVGKKIKNSFPLDVVLEHLAEVVETALLVAGSFDINAQFELVRHFPDKCGYCDGKPCHCNLFKEKPKRLVLDFPPHWWREVSVASLQEMMFGIYPKPKTRQGALELALHQEDELREVCLELNRERELKFIFSLLKLSIWLKSLSILLRFWRQSLLLFLPEGVNNFATREESQFFYLFFNFVF